MAQNEADAIKKCDNEWAPSSWPSLFTFMAAPHPILYTYPVNMTHLCQCSQKVAQIEGDVIKKYHIEQASSSVKGTTNKFAIS